VRGRRPRPLDEGSNWLIIGYIRKDKKWYYTEIFLLGYLGAARFKLNARVMAISKAPIKV
jgi:hypothetical protein